MMQSYIRGSALSRRLRQLGLAAVLVGSTALAAQAQTFPYIPSSATNVAGTYTDLGTTGTAIATTNTDDDNSAAQNIGFTFSYNGTAFTQFVLNTNGYIKLGATAPVAPYFYVSPQETTGGPLNSTVDNNLILPFNTDLVAGATAPTEYRVFTSGTQGSRVCTIQWKNVADKASTIATQLANLSFQVKLYEGTNQVEFVYGAATAGVAATATYRTVAVGLKGSSPANDQLLTVQKASGTAWANAVIQTGDYPVATGNNAPTGHNVRATALPDAGRTYRFRTAIANDGAVAAVYTLGKLATPAAIPHVVQAVVRNNGLTALTSVPVTLTVTGPTPATTVAFTDTKPVTLAVGASTTVSFAAYPTTLAVGTYTVAVSIPADGNNANNQATYTQQITTSRLSTIDPSVPIDGALSVSNTSPGGVLAVKYTVSAVSILSDVVLSFANTGSTNTNTYQAVVYDATGTGSTPGNVLYTSATQARPAAGGDITVTLPSVQVPTTFYVGVKEVEVTAGGSGIGTQTESPLRPTTYYYSNSGAAPWNDVAATTLQTRLGIEAGLAPAPNCTAPTAVAVSNVTFNSATITFTAPATGTSGYQLLYGPAGFNPYTAGTTVTATTSPATLTGLSAATTYQVYVRSSCTAGGFSVFASPVSFTTSCDPNPVVSAFPYNQNFDTILSGQSLPCGVAVLDANADGATWAISKAAPNSGVNSMRYTSAIPTSPVANDWFFTPALATTAGTRYQLAFRYRGEGIANSPSTYVEKLEVKSGAAATVAGMTNTLYTNSNITNTSYQLANGASAPAVAVLQPAAGNQFIGFHAISDANQGNLYVDDLSISTVLATSEVLMRAITVFPNPSTTGVFDLEIHGANAKGALDVTVSNTLGQRVYTGSARDNYTNILDLSTLAAGIYHLQVRTGDQYLTRQVSIVK